VIPWAASKRVIPIAAGTAELQVHPVLEVRQTHAVATDQHVTRKHLSRVASKGLYSQPVRALVDMFFCKTEEKELTASVALTPRRDRGVTASSIASAGHRCDSVRQDRMLGGASEDNTRTRSVVYFSKHSLNIPVHAASRYCHPLLPRLLRRWREPTFSLTLIPR